jgi:hypothetical protein
MFVFIRKHQTWGLIFIGLVIISFVVFFSPYSKLQGRGGGRRGDYGSIDGKAISSDEYFQALKEAKLEYLLRYRTWPEENSGNQQLGFDSVKQAMNRLFLLKELKDHDIEASDRAVANQIADYFQDRNKGGFDLQNYERFIQVQLLPAGITRSDFELFVRHEVGVQHLVSLAGLNGGLVTPREAEAAFRKENEQVSALLVNFSISNFLAQVTADPAALAQFYTNREALYRIPERVQVAYVKFDPTNFVAESEQLMAKDMGAKQITNVNQFVDLIYLQRGTNGFKDELNQVLPEAAAKEKIKEQVQKEYGLQAARRKAAAFANEVYNQPPQADSLDKLAAAHGYQAQLSEPFSANQVPPGLKVSRDFTEKAFRLTPDAPFATPIVGEDGVYVIAFKQRLPSVAPALEEIRETVTADYRNNQARELARQAGMQAYNVLTNGLAQGKTFETVCAETNLTAISMPPLSAQTRSLPEIEPLVSISELKNVALGLQPGNTSGFIPTRQGGFILHVNARLPVPEERLKTELPEFMTELRQERQYAAFNDWFSKELERSKLRMPPGYKSSPN